MRNEIGRFIEEEWDRINIQEINKEILTMEERIKSSVLTWSDVTEF